MLSSSAGDTMKPWVHHEIKDSAARIACTVSYSSLLAPSTMATATPLLAPTSGDVDDAGLQTFGKSTSLRESRKF